jgi:hypothetical protein
MVCRPRISAAPRRWIDRKRSPAEPKVRTLGAPYTGSVHICHDPSWGSTASFLLFGSTPPQRTWPITVGIVAATTALTVAAGLWRYRNFGLAQAALAGLSIYVVDFASGASLIEGLLAHDVPRKLASDWWGTTLYAPCTLLVLAAFDPAFRRFSTLATLAVAFCGPYGLLVWLNDSATFAMVDTTMLLLFLAVFSLWLAAIGYALQHPAVGEVSVRSAKPKIDGGHGASPSIPVTRDGAPKVA